MEEEGIDSPVGDGVSVGKWRVQVEVEFVRA